MRVGGLVQKQCKQIVSHTTFVALLRGINLGGKNKLAMKDLAAMFAAAGCEDVRTYIQSGNVIFSAGPGVSDKVCAIVTSRIVESFGLRIPVILRTASQLRGVISGNPFVRQGAAPESLHVMFLADWPSPQLAGALDPNRSTPDAFKVCGQEIYLSLPNGAGKTKLTNAYFDSKLTTVSTVRNWRTVNKLLELMEA